MRTKYRATLLAAVIPLCLISPFAHAQSSYDAEHESDRINDEIAAYQEGRADGERQLQFQQQQGWTLPSYYSSGCH